MEKREKCRKYTWMAKRLIRTEPLLKDIADSDVRIAYLSSDLEKKKGDKLVAGQCEKIPEKYKWSVPYDFTITIFEPNIERMTDEQVKIVLYHELLHVGIRKDGNEEQYYVREHDIEDFRDILDRYGLDWSRYDEA